MIFFESSQNYEKALEAACNH